MKVSPIQLVIFVTFFQHKTSTDSELSLDITYTAPSDMKCIKCSPGTYLLRHCSKENTNAQCELCEDGTYTSDYNTAEYCDVCMTACEIIPLVPIRNCSHSSNMVCECPNGTFNLFPDQEKYHAVCREFGPCQPGYGVDTKGTHTKNTTCVRCRSGRTFSPTISAVDECRPCTVCRWGVQSECTLVQDRKCHREPPDEHRISPPDNGMEVKIEVPIGIGTVLALLIPSLIVTIVFWLYRSRRGCFKKDFDQAEPRPCTDSSWQYREGYSRPANPTILATLQPSLLRNQSPPEMPPPSSLNQPKANSWELSFTSILPKVVDGLLRHGSSWECIIRELYLEVPANRIDPDVKIRETKLNYPVSVREQIYQCLKSICEVGATPDILIKVLTRNNLHLLVTALCDDFPDVFNAGRVESEV